MRSGTCSLRCSATSSGQRDRSAVRVRRNPREGRSQQRVWPRNNRRSHKCWTATSPSRRSCGTRCRTGTCRRPPRTVTTTVPSSSSTRTIWCRSWRKLSRMNSEKKK
uniref:(northern house mosquito) hypothetical protein n=1 Tax=Culex pipiens TaxID=7175 RepID=A0A8D8KST5_CULPI